MIAIDLGSNTIRFIEFDGLNWGKSFEKIVRTAESLDLTGQVSHEAVDRIVDAFSEAKQVVEFRNQTIVGVTTAAIRMATNQKEVLSEIATRCNVHFTVIDGIEEARLTLLAVQNRLNLLQLTTEEFILVDIGGASSEITLMHDKKVFSTSLNIGILTMHEKSLHTPLSRLLADFASNITDFINSKNLAMSVKPLILTAGTPTTIAAYKMGMSYESYSPKNINGSTITMQDCIQTFKELSEMDTSLCAYYVGVGREGLIPTGILMVQTLFKAIGVDKGIVIDDGLREGVALDYFFSESFPI
ncbi:MAG: phosphatase [Sulfuricurvum sp.]|uniref:Ppx/GppA phosphatase family protein n=1 Tax=Sulfuricurvum sp. TaxID=2025608 RepID=UPI00260C8A2A|nr:phosphatase [Sulfuricurvum sp.]MDD2829011.1 phosphatase [Sulfuricurvum sp.]MDD4949658.1 phosphatase [Sulfuricurvum sp.]